MIPAHLAFERALRVRTAKIDEERQRRKQELDDAKQDPAFFNRYNKLQLLVEVAIDNGDYTVRIPLAEEALADLSLIADAFREDGYVVHMWDHKTLVVAFDHQAKDYNND